MRETDPLKLVFCVGGVGEHAVRAVPRPRRRSQHGEEHGPGRAASHRKTASRSGSGTGQRAWNYILLMDC